MIDVLDKQSRNNCFFPFLYFSYTGGRYNFMFVLYVVIVLSRLRPPIILSSLILYDMYEVFVLKFGATFEALPRSNRKIVQSFERTITFYSWGACSIVDSVF